MAREVEDWRQQALCRNHHPDYLLPKSVTLPSGKPNPEAWYPEYVTNTETKKPLPAVEDAKQVCRQCPVMAECAEAGKYEVFGIWGGEHKRPRTKPRSERHRTEGAHGPRRRLQALATMGWGTKDISNNIFTYSGLRIGYRTLDLIRSGQDEAATPETSEQISRAYIRLRRSIKPASTAQARSTASVATGKGWLSPRDWEGHDIDDPEVYPYGTEG